MACFSPANDLSKQSLHPEFNRSIVSILHLYFEADTSFQSTDTAVMSQELNTSQEDMTTPGVLETSFNQTQPQTQVFVVRDRK